MSFCESPVECLQETCPCVSQQYSVDHVPEACPCVSQQYLVDYVPEACPCVSQQYSVDYVPEACPCVSHGRCSSNSTIQTAVEHVPETCFTSSLHKDMYQIHKMSLWPSTVNYVHFIVSTSPRTYTRYMSLCQPAVGHVQYQRHVLVSFACRNCTRGMSLHSHKWNMYLVHVPLLAIQDSFSDICFTAGCAKMSLLRVPPQEMFMLSVPLHAGCTRTCFY